MDTRPKELGTEVLYQSPTMVSTKSNNMTMQCDDDCSQCAGISKEKSNKNMKSESKRSSRLPNDGYRNSTSHYLKDKTDMEDKGNVKCQECSTEPNCCNFWKKYENVDKEPVKESSQIASDTLESSSDRESESQVKASTNYYTKNVPLFTVFEGEKTSSDASNYAEKTKLLQKANNHMIKKTVELQTDESNTGDSVDDSLDSLIKNILYKLLESNSNHRFTKTEYEEFVNRNRERCKALVERMIEDLVLSDSVDSSVIISKEKEVASYNYLKKVNSIETDTDTSFSTTTSESQPLSNKIKMKIEPDVLISTEMKRKKDLLLPGNKIKDKHMSYADIVQDLLKKCFDHSSFSELTCKIENFKSKEGLLDENNEDMKVSFSQPNSTIKVRLSNHYTSKSSDNSNTKVNTLVQENQKYLDPQTNLNPLDSKKEHAEETKDFSDADIEISVCKTNKDKNNKPKLTKPRQRKQESNLDTSQEPSDIGDNASNTVHNIGIIPTEKGFQSKNEVKRLKSDVKPFPPKISYPINHLHLEDSDLKTNDEARSVLSRICMFFCRRSCRN